MSDGPVYTISQEAARSRQTAMEAERHWWVTRLRELSIGWATEAAHHSDCRKTALRNVCWQHAVEVDALVNERTK